MSVRPRVQEWYSRSEEVIYVAGHDAEVMQDRPSASSNRASLSRRRLPEGDERARSAAAAPRADLWGLSVLGRFNSLIGRLGNLVADVSQYHLPARIQPLDSPESGVTHYLPVYQGTRSTAPYSAIRRFSL